VQFFQKIQREQQFHDSEKESSTGTQLLLRFSYSRTSKNSLMLFYHFLMVHDELFKQLSVIYYGLKLQTKRIA
jgi:hypothetical protein